jgi:hypothetical protein
MPHFIIYCSLEKLENGPVHVNCEDRAFVAQLGFGLAQKSFFGNAEQMRLQVSPTALMDALAQRGYVLRTCSPVMRINARHTFDKNYILWTMFK